MDKYTPIWCHWEKWPLFREINYKSGYAFSRINKLDSRVGLSYSIEKKGERV